jgi:hypothetical protein
MRLGRARVVRLHGREKAFPIAVNWPKWQQLAKRDSP